MERKQKSHVGFWHFQVGYLLVNLLCQALSFVFFKIFLGHRAAIFLLNPQMFTMAWIWLSWSQNVGTPFLFLTWSIGTQWLEPLSLSHCVYLRRRIGIIESRGGALRYWIQPSSLLDQDLLLKWAFTYVGDSVSREILKVLGLRAVQWIKYIES